MAGTQSVTTPSGSAPASSAMEMLDKRQLPRALFKIHKQQQELLDKAESWAQYLTRTSKPGVNLPPQVLENLRNFQKRQMELVYAQESEEPGDNEHENTPMNGNMDQRSSISAKSTPEDGMDEGEDAGVPIPWSSSPVRDQDAVPVARRLLSISPTTTQRPQPTDEATEVEQFMSQLPAKWPAQPTMDAVYSRQKALFNDFPSSSLGPESELEVAAPRAFTKTFSTLHKSTEPNLTPPSAQIQVPCTFDAKGSIPLPREEVSKSRPCSDLASIQTVLGRVATSSKTAMLKSMPPAQATVLEDDIPDSQSSINSASSMIPATNIAKPHITPPKFLKLTGSTRVTVKETPQVSRQSISQSMTTRKSTPDSEIVGAPVPNFVGTPRQQTPIYDPGSPQPDVTSPKSSRHHSPNGLLLRRVIPSDTAESPFLRYCMAYPGYNGDLTDFLAACLSIPKGRLATYQYDDFIRAWLEEYLPYYELTGNALPCIDWYIDAADELPASFQSRIVTKANLGTILELYADNIEKMRHNSAKPKKARELSGSPHPENENLKQDLPKISPINIDEEDDSLHDKTETPRKASSQVAHEEVYSSESSLDQVNAINKQDGSQLDLMPEKDVRTLPQKRHPTAHFDGTVAKRVHSSSIPSSEAGMTGRQSLAPKSSNPTKTLSREGFKNFVREKREGKRRVRDDISITSSAPIHTDSTSVEKGARS